MDKYIKIKIYMKIFLCTYHNKIGEKVVIMRIEKTLNHPYNMHIPNKKYENFHINTMKKTENLLYMFYADQKT